MYCYQLHRGPVFSQSRHLRPYPEDKAEVCAGRTTLRMAPFLSEQALLRGQTSSEAALALCTPGAPRVSPRIHHYTLLDHTLKALGRDAIVCPAAGKFSLHLIASHDVTTYHYICIYSCHLMSLQSCIQDLEGFVSSSLHTTASPKKTGRCQEAFHAFLVTHGGPTLQNPLVLHSVCSLSEKT